MGESRAKDIQEALDAAATLANYADNMGAISTDMAADFLGKVTAKILEIERLHAENVGLQGIIEAERADMYRVLEANTPTPAFEDEMDQLCARVEELEK